MDSERNIILYQAPAAPAATIEHFVGPPDRAINVKSLGYLLHTAGGDEDERASIDWDYTLDGTNFIQIGSVFSNIDVGLTPTITVKDQVSLVDELNFRVPPGAVLRCTIGQSGTTPTYRMYPYLTYNTL